MYQLRKYQQTAINKMIWSLSLSGNSVVSMAQGSGKSHVISGFANQHKKPILILVPSKELLEQDLDKLLKVINKKDIGIFSASMNTKEVKKYTIATIQSAHKYPDKFEHYEVALIDECQQVSPKRAKGMYNKFFRKIGNPKVIGLTATPFRQDVYYEQWGHLPWMKKAITTTKIISRYYPKFWDRIIYTLNVKELVKDGYLVPLTYKDISVVKHKDLKTNKTKTEFDLEDFDNQICKNYTSFRDLIVKTPHNKKLIFCSSISQAETLSKITPKSAVVTSKTTKTKREGLVSSFRKGDLKILYGVNIFSIGFDVPDIDCIFSLRPTRSLMLWTQVLGRGTRTSKGKKTCYVYDLVDNIQSLGTLESMEIKKINGKWDVTTNTKPDGFHMKKLFSYQLKENF